MTVPSGELKKNVSLKLAEMYAQSDVEDPALEQTLDPLQARAFMMGMQVKSNPSPREPSEFEKDKHSLTSNPLSLEI